MSRNPRRGWQATDNLRPPSTRTTMRVPRMQCCRVTIPDNGWQVGGHVHCARLGIPSAVGTPVSLRGAINFAMGGPWQPAHRTTLARPCGAQAGQPQAFEVGQRMCQASLSVCRSTGLCMSCTDGLGERAMRGQQRTADTGWASVSLCRLHVQQISENLPPASCCYSFF